MAAITICSEFGAQQKKVCHCFHCFIIYLSWSDGTRWHDHSFLSFFILLYNIVLVLPYIELNLPWMYICSPSWTPPPTSHPIPCLWVIPVHQPWAPCIMHWTWTGDSFHVIFYMFQCHSPISSCPHTLPQSPKDCSIYLCLFCCLAYRVIIIFFLNSIYMC